MAETSNHYLVILCGGTGPRLWPLSRADFPKQFLKINSSYSLLQNTILRSRKIVPSQNIFIVSNDKYFSTLKKQIGDLIPSKNILTEPEKKNTLAALIFATIHIQTINPQAVITSLPSDHQISHTDKYIACIKKTYNLANSSHKIITIGIKPTFANPSYGYIIPDKKFVEKPDINEAQKLIKLGALWNSGIYTFSSSSFLTELATHQKDIFNLSKLIQNHPVSKLAIKNFFHQVPSIAFDVAISEKTKNLSTIKATFSWSDIGEWKTIYKLLAKKTTTIQKLNSQTNFVQIDSSGCLISSESNKLIGLVGVDDLAIIDTPDSLLVCHLQDSFQVRDLIGQIVKNKSTEKYFLKSYDSKSTH
jgi:mannose-1-phosphate guanylyltransferase